jgi:hypothetical protein
MDTADLQPHPPPAEDVPAPSPTFLVVLGSLIAVALLLGIGAAFSRSDDGSARAAQRAQVRETATAWLAAWEAGNDPAMDGLVARPVPGGAGPAHTAALEQLDGRGLRARALADRLDGERATVAFTADLDVGGLGRWSWRGELALVDTPEGWRVDWSPAAIHPALAPGRTLRRTRALPERAPVLAADGTPLTGPLAADLPVARAQVVGRVEPLAGLAIPEEGADRDAETANGEPVGDPPADGAPAGPEPAGAEPSVAVHRVAGDPVGVSGLQAAFDDQLGGRASGSVEVLDASGAVVEVLARFPGEASRPLRTTIDPAVQAAAEAALAGGRPAALVAVHGPTGEVRAVVSRPAAGFNRALEGRYPPGSTFKVVTAAALLDAGVTLDEVVPCPASTVVDGRRIGNAGGEELGPIPFRTAFFRSCNTAFVRLAADRLDAASITAGARHFGFGDETRLGIPAVGGSFPEPGGRVELIAAAIGQARVTVSPVHMASVAAAVQAGAWRPPTLVAGRPTPGRPLPAPAAAVLPELMRLVVEQGTGTAARLPGTPVAGKTGTAEFGTRVPPRTHAWFIGFRGELAFAVVVEDAGFGGEVAAPVAADFLRRVGASGGAGG